MNTTNTPHKLCVTSKIGTFLGRLGCLLVTVPCVGVQIGIFRDCIEIISTTTPGRMRSTIVVSALLAFIFTLVTGLIYFFLSMLVFLKPLYVDNKGIYTDHRFIPWGAIVKIKCLCRSNLPTITIRYMENGKRRKVTGALPIFNARHYADIVESLYEHQGRNWDQIVGYEGNSQK